MARLNVLGARAIRAALPGIIILSGATTLIPPTAAQQPPPARDTLAIPLNGLEFGRSTVSRARLIEREPVRQELKITDEQRRALAELAERSRQRLQKAREATRLPATDPKYRTSAAALHDAALAHHAELRAILTPEQDERLGQIQLQVAGPAALAPLEPELRAQGEPPLARQFGMTDEQIRRARAIVAQEQAKIEAAARVVIPGKLVDSLPTIGTLRSVLESPDFAAAKQAAHRAKLDAYARLTRRIEDEVLTESQRAAYRKRLGPPCDLTRILPLAESRFEDYCSTADVLGLRGLPWADLDYDTKVLEPAYTGAARRPRILFDEGHDNDCPALGYYLPLDGLLASDGYRIVRSRQRFQLDVLRQADVLIVGGPQAAPRRWDMTQMWMAEIGGDPLWPGDRPVPVTDHQAFTDAECDAVSDWVREGGALLLVVETPRGVDATRSLAARFGVELDRSYIVDAQSNRARPPVLLFSRADQLLGDHAITQGRNASERLERVATFLGHSLKGPPGCSVLLELGDSAFRVISADRKPESAAGRAQAVAFRFGRGRVVVLVEAAAITATSWGPPNQHTLAGMNVPGNDNRQFALNILHWLSGLLEPPDAPAKKAS